MPKVSATVFKARCLEFMDRVAEGREAYVVTKRGKAVARLVPIPRRAAELLLGRLSGVAEELGDIVRPVVPSSKWGSQKRVPRRRDR